jgi:putative copper export protein
MQTARALTLVADSLAPTLIYTSLSLLFGCAPYVYLPPDSGKRLIIDRGVEVTSVLRTLACWTSSKLTV